MLSNIESQNGSSSSTPSSQSNHNLSPGYTSQIPSPLTTTPTSSKCQKTQLYGIFNWFLKFSSSDHDADNFSRSVLDFGIDRHHNAFWQPREHEPEHELPAVDAHSLDQQSPLPAVVHDEPGGVVADVLSVELSKRVGFDQDGEQLVAAHCAHESRAGAQRWRRKEQQSSRFGVQASLNGNADKYWISITFSNDIFRENFCSL